MKEEKKAGNPNKARWGGGNAPRVERESIRAALTRNVSGSSGLDLKQRLSASSIFACRSCCDKNALTPGLAIVAGVCGGGGWREEDERTETRRYDEVG